MTKNLKEHELKKIIHALKDPRWIKAMQEELLQFKLQKGLDSGGFTKIEAIRLFLAYASFKDFVVYQMDVKSAFLYDCLRIVALRRFQMSYMGKLTFFLGLQVKQKEDGIFLVRKIDQGIRSTIIKTRKRGAYQIIKEDNTDVVYVKFQGLLNDLTRDDLKELYRLMMLKYGDNMPEEEFVRVLWGDLKTMFDPPSEEDAIWKLPHQQQILNWRYFHSCSVHCLTVEAAHIYMLTEVKYPLPPRVCKAMLEKKLLGDRKDEIVEWHGYKHLDWITIRRDDDKLHTFKEGDFKRLRLQDIEDMLLLLVQGKLTNLNVEERLAFSVSFRMFTRSIVIQRRVEDLQLGVEIYQKKLNITKPDSYRSDLKRREAYSAYSNPRGFIYQNRDKKNRLMRVDELHKFSDGTLNDGTSKSYDPGDRQTTQVEEDNEKYGKIYCYKAVRLRYSNLMIQPEPEGSTQGYLLVSVEVLRFNTSAGNPVKEILLKLNLPDHKSILTDLKVTPTRHGRMTKPCVQRSHSRQAKEQAQDLTSMITTSNHKLMIEVKDYKLKTKVKA
ncbi:hypothetical protein Tco_1493570 [Tanacetum coccineum]